MIKYDPHDWKSHFLAIQGSVIREIIGRLLWCGLWSTLVVAAHFFLKHHHGISLAIPETAHALVGVALGLLLVLRTNASYDRFWEGRKQWGAIVNASRNLARGASVYLAQAPDLVMQLLLWTIAFAHTTRNRLRGSTDMGPIAAELPAAEVQAALAEKHLPLAISRRMSRIIGEGRSRDLISDKQQATLDSNVESLVDALGACERIHNTPMPFAYVVHLRRALVLYCATLPFALVDRFGWGAIAAVILIAYNFFGIEETGVEIEDPFGFQFNDLPLDDICGTLEGDLRGVIAALPGDKPA